MDVEDSYFYFLMLKVITFTLGCSKFLFLVLDVENSCSYSWILKVLTFFLDAKTSLKQFHFIFHFQKKIQIFDLFNLATIGQNLN